MVVVVLGVDISLGGENGNNSSGGSVFIIFIIMQQLTLNQLQTTIVFS